MSEAIITVEGLGKRYRLGASRSNERYTALRDVISDKAKNLFRRNGYPTSRRAVGPLGLEADLRPEFTRRGGTSAPASQEFWALKDVSFEVKRGVVPG